MTDAGARAVDFVFRQMQVDAEWSIRGPREFTWWGHDLAQRVLAEPPIRDHGLDVSRLVATTTIVRNVQPSADTFKLLNVMNAQGAILSGFVFDPGERTVTLACTAKVYDDPRSKKPDGYSALVSHYFATAVAAQASQAQHAAAPLATILNGIAAASQRPGRGPRENPDDMLGTLGFLMTKGQSTSEWAGAEMRHALRSAEQMGALATGSDDGMAAEFQFHDQTALMTMSTREEHPTVGRGLLVRLALPLVHDPGEGMKVAAALNLRELRENYFNAFMGGWCLDSRGLLTFVAFYPNARIGNGYAGLVAQQMALRCRWAGRSVFEDERPPARRASFLTSLGRVAGFGPGRGR
jgi:hypothetical protein